MTAEIRDLPTQAPAPGELVSITKGVYWLRMPLPIVLDHINLYLLEEDDGWTIIDTGMNTADIRGYWEQIFSAHLAGKPVKQVIVTHMHPDHVGLAGWLCEQHRCPLYMTQVEYFAVRAYVASKALTWETEHYFRACGLGDDYVDFMAQRMGFGDIVAPMPGAYRRLHDGQTLLIGGRAWQVIVGAGHSLAHASLYCHEDKLLLAGDQILPKISPNVGVLATEPLASPLHDWYLSLKRLLTLSDETLVLPAHKQPFHGLHARAKALIQHHESQLKVILKACAEAKRPLDLLPFLFGREIQFAEMGLALGECKAHLHMLLDRQLIRCEYIAGVEHYTSLVDMQDEDVHYEFWQGLQI